MGFSEGSCNLSYMAANKICVVSVLDGTISVNAAGVLNHQSAQKVLMKSIDIPGQIQYM